MASPLAPPDRPESGGEFDMFGELNTSPVRLLFFSFFVKSKGPEQSSVNSIFHSLATTTTVTHHLMILCFEVFWVGFGGGVLFVCFMKLCDERGSPVQKGLDFSNQDES